jgi:uncharacterized protein
MAKTPGVTLLHVSVMYSPQARVVHQLPLQLLPGATVRNALQLAANHAEFSAVLAQAQPSVGVWSKRAKLDQKLLHNDQIEIYRPLRVDPKVARRERFAKQGARTTGLFATRRPGAKSGY